MKRAFTRLAICFGLFAITAQIAFAQNTNISGTVIDKLTNETLPGVSIAVKGKAIGTSTTTDGTFSLSTSESTPFTLVISYIGYKTIEQTISGSASGLRIEMEANCTATPIVGLYYTHTRVE